MFVYQTKINNHDGLVLVAETKDAGKQIPVTGNVLAVYEDNGVLVSANGSLAEDGTFTPAE